MTELASKKGHFDLTEIRSLLGKEIPLDDDERFISEQPVDASEIRRFMFSCGDYNPLWWDEEYAKRTKWGGIIAPATFLHASPRTLGRASIGVHVPGTDFWARLHGGQTYELYRPIRVGDRIIPSARLIDVQEKVSKALGPIVVSTAEARYTDQRGEQLGIGRETFIRYALGTAQEKKHYALPQDQSGDPGHEPQIRKPKITARGAQPRYFEDVETGELVTPLEKKLTIPDIALQATKYRVGCADLSSTPGPACYWHYVPSAAWQFRAMPGAFDHGVGRMVWAGQMMTDWIGDDGWLRSISIRNLLPNFAGDTVICRAKVVNKRAVGGEGFVDCEYWLENLRSGVSSRGEATVVLPFRRPA